MKNILLLFALFLGLFVNAQDGFVANERVLSLVTSFSIDGKDYIHVVSRDARSTAGGQEAVDKRNTYCFPDNAIDRDMYVEQGVGGETRIYVEAEEGEAFTDKGFVQYTVSEGPTSSLLDGAFVPRSDIVYEIVNGEAIAMLYRTIIECGPVLTQDDLNFSGGEISDSGVSASLVGQAQGGISTYFINFERPDANAPVVVASWAHNSGPGEAFAPAVEGSRSFSVPVTSIAYIYVNSPLEFENIEDIPDYQNIHPSQITAINIVEPAQYLPVIAEALAWVKEQITIATNN